MSSVKKISVIEINIIGLVFTVCCFFIGYYVPYMRSVTYGQFIDKQENFIIEKYSSKYATIKHNKPYIIEKIGEERSIVAFPIKRKTEGYVVILSASMGWRTLKVMPIEYFELTQEMYAKINTETTLSSDVDDFIASHIIK